MDKLLGMQQAGLMELLGSLVCCARARQGDDGDDWDSAEDRFGLVDNDLPDFNVTRMAITMADLSGCMYKLGKHKPPKKRWFVLKNDLYYFDDENSLQPKGVVLLGAQPMLSQVTTFTTEDNQLGIEVSHPSFVHLRASDLSKWLDAFRELGIQTTVAGKESEVLEVPEAPEIAEGEVETPICEGVLSKRAFADSWKSYYCRLYHGRLDYFKDKDDEAPKGSYTLSHDIIAPFITIATYMQPTDTCLLTFCNSLRVVTDDEEEHADWFTSIKASIDHKKQNPFLQKNPTGWKRSGKVREVVVPILDLLRDPFRVDFFRQFLESLDCGHYLKFWLDVQQYRRLCKKEDSSYLVPCADVILGKYVKRNSVFEVDLPEQMRAETAELVQKPNIDTFKDPQRHIMQILSEHYYPLYLTSDLCGDMAQRLLDS